MGALLADGAAILAAFELVWLTQTRSVTMLPAVIVIIAVFSGTAINSQAYSVWTLRDPVRSISLSLRALLFSFGAMFLVLYFLRAEQDMSRLLLLVGMGFSTVAIAIVRYAAAMLIRSCWDGQLIATVALVDGVKVDLPATVTQIDASAIGIRPDLSSPVALNRFAELVRPLDRVVIACTHEAREKWAMMLKGSNVRGEIIVDDSGGIGAFGMGGIARYATLVVSSGPLTFPQRVSKRSLDLAITIPALVLLAPALIAIAIAIKLDSPGPAFFRQRRVGRANAFFNIVKFRSMRVEASDGEGKQSTLREDQRITRVGRFIRSTSIDELPQLLNVLGGSMSIVGPRPHALGSLAGSELFWEVDSRYWHRHACKPGLTGLAQVRGFRGATHRREDLINRLQADLEYMNGWSVWRDITIMLATLKVVMHPNAY